MFEKKALIRYIAMLICMFFWVRGIYAYDTDNVHPKINKSVVEQSEMFLSTLTKIGFDKGIDSIVKLKEVYKWFQDGGKEEDSGTRSLQHFHDPTKAWSNAGLKDSTLGSSSLFWAQNPNQSSITGNWSWTNARTYYYQALMSGDKTVREQNFADTFRALGQVMHLLADASVPEHTRNDIHVFPWFAENPPSATQIGSWTYETWCKYHVADLNTTVAAQDYGITNTSVVSGLNPIFNFWDTTPLPITGSFVPVGLAEYSNYNFLSSDTIFKDYAYPANPVATGGVLKIVVGEDGKHDKRVYFSGITSDSIPIEHLVSTGYLWDKLNKISPFSMDAAKFNLDDNCFQDYASILVPKAVSYSAGLLNYFFRGTIEISAPAQNVYAITDGSLTPHTDAYGHLHQEFTKIKAKVRNTTPNNEQIGAGTLRAVARYKIRIDYQPDLSGDPTDEHPEWGVSEDDFSYSVSEQITVASLGSVSTEFTFDFTTNPIPAGVTDLYLQVVFKGTIGNEADNAIAVGMKDLSEPAHQVFWNLTDQFSLLYTESTDTTTRYHLYTEQQLKDPSDENKDRRELVDLDKDLHFNETGEPYIDPYPMTFEISYLSQANPTTPPPVAARVTDLPAGKYIRLVMIQDREQPRIVRFSYSDQVHPASNGVSEQTYEAVINQSEPDGYFYYMPISTFRHGSSDGDPIRHHFYTGILNCSPMAIINGKAVCPYNETESIPAGLDPYGPVEMLFNN